MEASDITSPARGSNPMWNFQLAQLKRLIKEKIVKTVHNQSNDKKWLPLITYLTL